MQEIYERELNNLRLPQKTSIFDELKAKGKKYIAQGEIEKGAYCFGAAHYFWQNFIVISH